MTVALARRPTAAGMLMLILLTISVLTMGLSFLRNGRSRLGVGNPVAQRKAKQYVDVGTVITIVGAIMLVLDVAVLVIRR